MNKLLLGMALAAITSCAYAQAPAATAPEADVIYSNTFAESLDDWTITSDKEGWSGWYVNANKGCAACSSWTGELGTFIGESWMMKEFDLSEFDGVTLAVEQGFFRLFPQEQGDRFTLNIRKSGEEEWTLLPFTVFPPVPDGTNWTDFAANEFDLSAYNGMKVELGFCYNNPDAESVTWVLKNFILSGQLSTGVAAIGADSTAAPEYYNLQGVRVENPEKGIFVRVADGKAVKVVK